MYHITDMSELAFDGWRPSMFISRRCRYVDEMGHVYVDAVFYGQLGRRVFDRLLVDTGATYTILSRAFADEIGVFMTPYKIQLTLADKSKRTATIGLAEVEVEGRREPVQIAVVDDGVPVLGVQALEVLGFEVNPVAKRLEAIRESGGLALFTYKL